MKLLTKSNREQLLRNGRVQAALAEEGREEADFLPVVKLFTPDAGCCAASTSTPISTSLSSDTIGASTGTSRSKPCSGSPRTITRRVTGISSGATIPAKARRQSGARRGAAGQRPACGQMDQGLPKKPKPSRSP
jgi:Protein of unknown function (DUF2958)